MRTLKIKSNQARLNSQLLSSLAIYANFSQAEPQSYPFSSLTIRANSNEAGPKVSPNSAGYKS
jgi:hypothetical protein